jgi:capsular polysaccharide transport system permease protein
MPMFSASRPGSRRDPLPQLRRGFTGLVDRIRTLGRDRWNAVATDPWGGQRPGLAGAAGTPSETGSSSLAAEPGAEPDPSGFNLANIPRPSPYLLGLLVVLLSGLYFFGIGRNRYQVVSDFIVRQPETPSSTGSSLLGPIVAGPTMMGSIEDGRFLAVYLSSPEVMRRVFLRLRPQTTYARKGKDPFAGLPRSQNFDQELAFFRRQIMVWPQELTGVIRLTTIGLDPTTSYQLNRLLIAEAEGFLNTTNQAISRDQLAFAEKEVGLARERLLIAQRKLSAFQDQYGLIAPAQEAQATSSYITALESRLVDLKVQEASLKRQYKDPQSPEVAFVTDQVAELQRQIDEERALLVAPQGKDVNKRLAQGQQLENEVSFATNQLTAALQAATNSRQKSQMQLKFLVVLSDPTVPQQQYFDWRWKGFLASLGILVVLWGGSSFILGVVNRK